MHRSLRCLSIAAIIASVASCRDPATAPLSSPRSERTLVPPAASSAGTVIFLPPLGAGHFPRGASDVSRRVEVEICVRSDTTCAGTPVVRFRTDAQGLERLLILGGQRAADDGRATYAAYWRVPFVTPNGPRRYRITVLVDGGELAHRDIVVLDLIRDLLRGSAPSHSPDESLVLGGLPLPILFWIEKAPQRLTVQLGAGVTGTPAAGDSLWPNGTKVPYAFTPAPGYENVLVRLDGLPAPATGTVVTDSAHGLSVSADRRVTVAPAAVPLYQTARALLTAADPVAAFQSYLDDVAMYVDAHDADTALRHLQDVEYLAFDPIRDSAALRRVDAALAGHEFMLGTDSAAGAAGVAGNRGITRNRGVLHALEAAAALDSLERTMFLYVNGIWTPQFGPDGAAAAYVALRILVSRVPLLRDQSVFAVHYFYNRTHSEQRPTPDEQRAHCTAAFVARLALGYQGVNAFGPFMSDCTTDPTYRRFSDTDLIEAMRQVVALIANTDAAETDAIALAQRIQTHRGNGRHVILVPHSQGNLMANQAIHHLRSVTNEYDPVRDSTCIGVVSLASPSSRRWELSEHYLVPIVVHGDAVPSIDNDWPTIDTDLSHKLLDHPSLSNAFTPTGIILHNAIESYMEQPQSRAAIQDGLQSVYGACAVRNVSVRPATFTMPVGNSTVLLATPFNAFGDTLGGRQFSWSNGSPSVTALTQTSGFTTTARGLTAGTSVISARSHAGHGDATVTVTQPTPSNDPYSFSYVASYPAGFFGDDQHLSGTGPTPGPVPLPAGTLRVTFFSHFGQLSAVVNSTQYAVNTIYPDTVVLYGNISAKYRLVWNTERTSLSGTIDTQNWIYQVGWVPVLLPVTFYRETP